MISNKRIIEVRQGITPLSSAERGGIIMLLSSSLGTGRKPSFWSAFSDKDLVDTFLSTCEDIISGEDCPEEAEEPPPSINTPALAGFTLLYIICVCVAGYFVITL